MTRSRFGKLLSSFTLLGALALFAGCDAPYSAPPGPGVGASPALGSSLDSAGGYGGLSLYPDTSLSNLPPPPPPEVLFPKVEPAIPAVPAIEPVPAIQASPAFSIP